MVDIAYLITLNALATSSRQPEQQFLLIEKVAWQTDAKDVC
jgi:hypothetical protein